ncbi:hypothetical protein BJ508DRAFT_415329 [Ascobolus immersus RN42]|uniref:Zn(2)-C6 fungal-type domain-containing protein n=1 Tax=Ascobolus immersus RN42 TaxID=1160509 RepID=A0A3N4I7I6_ASCIM|nr:hypothetical protein BJ508DRAFT_415329 [Ascobolus immersus RN42]
MASSSGSGASARPSGGSRPVTAACLECRKRHLKCDGRQPVCSRCESMSVGCNWMRSRRGGKRTKLKANLNANAVAAAAAAAAASTAATIATINAQNQAQVQAQVQHQQQQQQQAAAVAAQAHVQASNMASMSMTVSAEMVPTTATNTPVSMVSTLVQSPAHHHMLIGPNTLQSQASSPVSGIPTSASALMVQQAHGQHHSASGNDHIHHPHTSMPLIGEGQGVHILNSIPSPSPLSPPPSVLSPHSHHHHHHQYHSASSSPEYIFADAAHIDFNPFNSIVPTDHTMPGVLTPFGAHLNLVDVFYHQFYPSHPFLPPHMRLIQSLRHNSETLTVLIPAVEYIASFYINIPDNSAFKQNAEQAVLESSSSSPFKLQALLLLAIGTHSSGFRETAEKYINKACEMVTELKLDQMDNNQENVFPEISDPVMRESLRRTVWEVFYNDVVLAAFRGDASQKMWRLLSGSLKLPCSDGEYVMQNIPNSPNFPQYENAYLSREADRTRCSSHAYRLDAVRLLAVILKHARSFEPSPDVAPATIESVKAEDLRIDFMLSTWEILLPSNLDIGMDFDPIMFQAHMIINCAIIFHHRPKSHLAYSLMSDTTVCAAPSKISPAASFAEAHTRKCLTSAGRIAQLITLYDINKCTPFFTCAVGIASIVHLASANIALLSGEEVDGAKQVVRLEVAALGKLARRWRVAEELEGQVRGMAKEVLGGSTMGGNEFGNAGLLAMSSPAS